MQYGNNTSNCQENLTPWTGYDCACNANNPPSAASRTAWREQSVVSDGADYEYPETAVMNIFCTPPTNNAAPQGHFFGEKMQSGNVYNYKMWLISDCEKPEHTWTGTHMPSGKSGLDVVIQWAGAFCHPRQWK